LENAMDEQERPSTTIEDYLGVIYTLCRDGERVIAARLVESLDVSPPTVNATLKRMVRDGWIKISEDKEISLTNTGHMMAMSVIRRHMLTEWMLSRVLKMPLSELHREAHHIEHTLSAEVELRLLEEMDDPTVCPHGNPLPGYEGEVRAWLPLSEVQVGDKVVLRRIHENIEDHYERLSYLDSEGLMPGAHISVIEVMPFNETVKIKVNEKEVTLGLTLAANIFVSPLHENY